MTNEQKRDVLEMILLAKQLKMKPKDVVAVFQKKYEGQEQPAKADLMQSIKQWWSWYGR